MSTKDNEIDLGRGLSIKYYKITNNNPSPYNLTSIWTNAKYFLKFIKVDNFGRAETKIPGRGKLEEFEKSFNNLKRKIEEKIPLLETDLKFLPVLSGFKIPIVYDDDKSSSIDSNSPSKTSLDSISSISTNITSSSSSEISISSQQSSDQGLSPLQKSNKSRIPVKNHSNVSFSSSISKDSFENLTSRISTPIPRRKNSNLLFNKNLILDDQNRIEKEIRIHQINKDKRWVLISPSHRFISQYRPTTTRALTFREHDKIRVEQLSKDEIKILEQMRMEDNLDSGIRFLGKK